jgi:hypothetical protein
MRKRNRRRRRRKRRRRRRRMNLVIMQFSPAFCYCPSLKPKISSSAHCFEASTAYNLHLI